MKWVFEIYPKKARYITATVVAMLGDILDIIPPILLGTMVDLFINNGFTHHVIPLAVSVLAFTLLSANLAYFGANASGYWRQDFTDRLKRKCYEKLNLLDQSFYNKTGVGELNTIMTSDQNQIGHVVHWIIRSTIIDILRFFVVFIYLCFINVPLSILILLPAPIIAFLSIKHMKKMEPLYDERRQERSNLNNYIQENIEGNKVVKSFASEKYEIDKFGKKNGLLKNKNLRVKYENINYDSKIIFLSEIMEVLLLLFGGYLLMQGSITVGDILIFSSLLWILKMPFLNIGDTISEFQEFKISKDRIQRLLDAPIDVKNNGKLSLDYDEQEIIFKDVDVAFDERYALKKINIKIEPGKTVACIGQVGSGKSTIARLVLRFIDPTKGKVYIGDNNIKKYTLESLRKNIGYVSQTPFLFSDTIRNNVNYGNTELSEEEIISCLKKAKADYVFKYPDGLDTIIGENGVSLSGGEKQRLSLARALAVKPKILILDDITSALDIETEIEVTKNIENLDYDATKIIIAQKIFSVKNADLILVFKDGKIVEQGTHTELLKLNGEYKNIYNIQKESYED